MNRIQHDIFKQKEKIKNNGNFKDFGAENISDRIFYPISSATAAQTYFDDQRKSKFNTDNQNTQTNFLEQKVFNE